MNRVAVVAGVRTPFVRAAGALSKYSALDLGVHVIDALVRRMKLNPKDVSELVFGTVLLDTRTPNLAREILFRTQLPRSITAHAISNNCITGLVAAAFVADGIATGRIDCGLAGGTESMSRPSLGYSAKGEAWFLKLARAKTISEKLALILEFRIGHVLPLPPSPKEPSTGLTMGEHCELMAKQFSIARALQDEWAFTSHQNGARAANDGFLGEEIEPIGEVKADNLIRPDTTIEKLSKLKPVFDRSASGTLTAGNSSSLTDGASVVCLMSEEKAKADGREILGFILATEFAAIEPKLGLLMAPALALPRVLKKVRLSPSDIDLFEIHEAFSAQVLANLHVWEHGWPEIGEDVQIGKIDRAKINLNGGSIAIGHPFAATGGRLILSALNQLNRSGKKRAAISVCAAGAMAGAMIVER